MSPSPASASLLSAEIDQLLEHYLSLLSQYTTLRTELSSLQASVFQNISRANFSAERGVRYGPDFYDARMHASRVCRITVPSLVQQGPVVGGLRGHDVPRDTRGEGRDKSTTVMRVDTACFAIVAPGNGSEGDMGGGNMDGEGKRARDPLRMFGLLIPSALREAQRGSVRSVEEIIPKIVEVDAEMKEVEIRIRRARKWMARAEVREGAVGEKETVKRVEVLA